MGLLSSYGTKHNGKLTVLDYCIMYHNMSVLAWGWSYKYLYFDHYDEQTFNELKELKIEQVLTYNQYTLDIPSLPLHEFELYKTDEDFNSGNVEYVTEEQQKQISIMNDICTIWNTLSFGGTVPYCTESFSEYGKRMQDTAALCGSKSYIDAIIDGIYLDDLIDTSNIYQNLRTASTDYVLSFNNI